MKVDKYKYESNIIICIAPFIYFQLLYSIASLFLKSGEMLPRNLFLLYFDIDVHDISRDSIYSLQRKNTDRNLGMEANKTEKLLSNHRMLIEANRCSKESEICTSPFLPQSL